MALECWKEIINDYERLFETDEGYDVIIYAGENENIKELHSHSIILRIRSQYFRTVFSSEWAKKKDGKFILEKPNISPDVFKIILKFIYCGKIDLRKFEGPKLLKLLVAADELEVQSLIPHIEESLIDHRYKFLKRNPVEIIETTYQNESFKNLQNFCLEEICKEPKILFNSDKFISLKAPILELLLKRDDMCLEEIVIWDNLMKWAFAQHPAIPKDFTKWNKEEVTIMERTLNKHIPLIRFYCLSSEDFLDKVYPLKELLPSDLVNSLLTFYLAPNRKASVDKQHPRRSDNNTLTHPMSSQFSIHNRDSIIIEIHNFTALFASWIDNKNDDSSGNIPYNFNLLYRSNRDGDTIAKFHEKTDNKGANIFIAKIKGTSQVIGGYNPLDWRGKSEWKSTADSFIFSFKNYKKINTGKIGRVVNTKYAVFGSNYLGPIFGQENNGSCDIMMQHYSNGNRWSSCPNSYPDIGIPRKFDVENYEVFRVVRRNRSKNI